MENLAFSMRNKVFKENKLRRVILSKISDVSEENLQTIIQAIDVNKQYYVKATRNPKKFLNFITEEKVCLYDKSFESKVVIIYGKCELGLFENHYGKKKMVNGLVVEDYSAAAVKSIISYSQDGRKTVEHLLIVYEPLAVGIG